jgi:hypothetical protein
MHGTIMRCNTHSFKQIRRPNPTKLTAPEVLDSLLPIVCVHDCVEPGNSVPVLLRQHLADSKSSFHKVDYLMYED